MQAICEIYNLLMLRGFCVCKRALVTPYIFPSLFWPFDADWFANFWCSVYQNLQKVRKPVFHTRPACRLACGDSGRVDSRASVAKKPFSDQYGGQPRLFVVVQVAEFCGRVVVKLVTAAGPRRIRYYHRILSLAYRVTLSSPDGALFRHGGFLIDQSPGSSSILPAPICRATISSIARAASLSGCHV